MTRRVPPGRAPVWSPAARVVLGLSLIAVLTQAVSLVARARAGTSDFSVLYRTAVLLNHGGGGELYAAPDAATGWPRCIPPVGMAVFQALAGMTPAAAAAVWAIVNLGLLAGALLALRACFEALDGYPLVYRRLFPWAASILMLLSIGSLQVGQFSLLFATCWVAYLWAEQRGRGFWAGLSLAIPSAVKLYPALMAAVPLGSGGRRWREFWGFAVALVVLCVVVPIWWDRGRAFELTRAFFEHVLLSPGGRVSAAQRAMPVSNQSLDAVLLRYLTSSARFISRYPGVPHLDLPNRAVLRLADLLRALILLVTTGVAARWRVGSGFAPRYGELRLAALWSAALYLVLPEAKARYAVYTFLAFLPLLESTVGAWSRAGRWTFVLRCALVAGCLAGVLGALPASMKAYGVGLIAPAALWVVNLQGGARLARRAARRLQPRQQRHEPGLRRVGNT